MSSIEVSQFSYVQAHDDPKLKNTQQARTIDCIYIWPIYNLQVGHYLFDEIFSDPDYIQKEKSDIEPLLYDQISEQEIDNLKKDQEYQNRDEEESINDEENPLSKALTKKNKKNIIKNMMKKNI